jgi:FMN phosphatase YigB (HAD superfamily)
MNRASSFDVFDTILTRQIGSPEAAFLLLGNQLQKRSLIACTAEAFARIRSTAEHRAFENAGGLDSCVNLDKIYEEVGFVLRLTVEERRQLLEIELSLEEFLLEPVPAALEILDQARKRGDRILFLSDMYIGTEFIQKILTHHGLMQMGDRLYVSCDYSQSKYSGKLYRRMLQQEGLAPKSVTHCGNSLRSDIKMAQRSQLKTKSFEQGNLNRYEEILETYVWETEGLSSALAGASRLARLSQPRRLSKRDAALQEISASVAAPFLVGFTLWILKRAKKLGLKRLYFLSRDGQILLAIAQRLIKKLDFDCELLYLYGSRQAWLLPSLTYLNEETLANIFPIDDTDVHLRSVRILLARFQLQPEDIAPSLLKLGLSSNDWARNLTVSESQALRDLFLTPGPVQDKILAQAAAARAMLKTHLRQCGALTGEPMGLVDVGTGATLFHALSEIFETEGMSPPHGFYLGLRQAVKDSRFGLPEVYLYDERHHLGLLRVQGLVTMLETFCSADHGSVVGYQAVGDRVEPILTELKNQRVLDWGYGLVQETICAVADRLLLDPILLNPEANLCAASLAVFNLFWTQPTCQESLALGTFPMEDGWGKESISICLATPYKWRDVLKRSSRRHWWHGGAIAQSSTPIQWMFKGRKLIRQRMR